MSLKRIWTDTLKRSIERHGGDEQGAALFEYALVLPVFAAVLFAIVAMGWWWWNQSVAAIAIHDGARDAAAHDGNLVLGYETTRRLLGGHLGRVNAEKYEGHFRLWEDGFRRAVRGEVDYEHQSGIPFLGVIRFRIRASSFQRRWHFYGGPPGYWE